MMTLDKYRIDWACDHVYEYQPEHNAYYFIGDFYSYGITHDDSNAQAIAKCERARGVFRVGDIVDIEGVLSGAEVIQIYHNRAMEDIELRCGILKSSRLRLKVRHIDHNGRKLVKWFDAHMVKLSIPAEVENKKQGGF